MAIDGFTDAFLQQNQNVSAKNTPATIGQTLMTKTAKWYCNPNPGGGLGRVSLKVLQAKREVFNSQPKGPCNLETKKGNTKHKSTQRLPPLANYGRLDYRGNINQRETLRHYATVRSKFSFVKDPTPFSRDLSF